MNQPTLSSEIKTYLSLLWRWAWLLALMSVVFSIVAFLVSRNITPVYQATTTVLINEAPATRTTDYTSIVTSERLAQTYSQLMVKQPVLQGVITSLELDLDVRDLTERILVQPVRDTTLIEVRVEDTDPQRAARITDALVSEFAAQNRALQTSRYSASKTSLENELAQLDREIQASTQSLANLGNGSENQVERDRLEATLSQYRQTYAYLLQSYEQVRLTEAQSTSNIVQVEPAAVPDLPVRPRTLVNTLLAGFVGLLLAVGTVSIIEALDDTIRSQEDVTERLGLPVLGLIAHYDADKGEPLTSNEPRSPVAEAFRSLRTNIQFASVDRPVKTLLVTSPSPSDGKSTVAVNLAVVMAQGGKRVAVLDADLRRPRIHKVLALANQVGLSDLFVQPELVLNGALRPTTIPSLAAITAGAIPPNPSELLGSERMYTIMAQVKDQVDLVILDSPPVVAVTDSVVLAPRVDGVILVLKPGATQLAAAAQAVEQLRRAGTHLLGVVLNDVDTRSSSYQYQGYYYSGSHYYSDDGQQAKKTRSWNWRKLLRRNKSQA